MDSRLEEQAEILVKKIRHYLLTQVGRLPEKAYPWEMFQAVSFALREEIMSNWVATANTFNEKRVRRLYYLSMEYLPGRMLVNNISNLHSHDLIKRVMSKLNYSYNQLLDLEPDPGLGNGGLGRLASCFLDTLATQKYPATAYGLRYQYGIFEQQIWDGVQIEKPDCWLLNENPWAMRHDGGSKIIKFAGMMKKKVNQYGEAVLDLQDFEEVRALPFDFPIIGYGENRDFNVITLRLWSTKESPHNFHLQRYNAGLIGPAAENTALTDVLYPNDNHDTGKRIRLKQEFLLVSASLQDILQRHLEYFSDLTEFHDKVRIQINDTHAALMVVELMRILTTHHNFQWTKAWDVTQEVMSFTNHTIMKEALEEWNRDRMANLLPRQYWLIEKINEQLCEEVRNRYPADEEKIRHVSIIEGGQIRMAHLAIYGSHKINGVARLHGEILKNKVFKDLYEMVPQKFTYVTNGVTQRHWLWHCNPELSDFITKRIQSKWILDFSQIQLLRDFATDRETQNTFLAIKRNNKEKLLQYLKNENQLRNMFGEPSRKDNWDYDQISLDAIFDVQIKRFHEYKRQLMNVLNLIMIYHDLLEDPNSRPIKRFSIFSGKAAAGYTTAKNVIHLINAVAKRVNADKRIENKLKIVFVENYSVTKAEKIMPAAELSEQISTAGMEASGTGNMKLALNGALTIGTEDGANIEMRESVRDLYWPFKFGASAEEILDLQEKGNYNPWDIYSKSPKIKKAVDALKNDTFAQNESEKETLNRVFDSLMLGFEGQRADRYFVLYDLESYYAMQKKVETFYMDQNKWAEYAIHNIAAMGPFSSDASVEEYAKEIWKINRCPVDEKIMEETRALYAPSNLDYN